VHLFGFIIKNFFFDARSHERKIKEVLFVGKTTSVLMSANGQYGL